MEGSDSRKRPLDGETESGVTKRSNQGASHLADDNVHLKLLIPSIAAGAIIGKGGETITQIQKDTGANIKMSKNSDFYPGTTERVCLISGSPESIKNVHAFIIDKIREKPDPNPKPVEGEMKVNLERHKQVNSVVVKILVPNSTAGMIIGKGGNFIRQIKDDSGAYVQISQKSKDMNLPERCVTVAGDLEQNQKAVAMILSKIVEDPQSSSLPNISYSEIKGPVASSNPTGSPYASGAQAQGGGGRVDAGGGGYNNGMMGGGGGPGPGPGGPQGQGMFCMNSGMNNLNLNPNNAGGMAGVMNPLENLKATLRGSGYTEQATDEISNAMYTLANYGFLGLGLGLGGMGMGGGMQGGNQGPQQQQPQQQGGNLTLANLAGILSGGTPVNSAGGNLLGNTVNDSGVTVFGPVGSTTTTMAGGDTGEQGGGGSYYCTSSMSGGSGGGGGGDRQYAAGDSMFSGAPEQHANGGNYNNGGANYHGENGRNGNYHQGEGRGDGRGEGGNGYTGSNQNSFGLGMGNTFPSNMPNNGAGEEGSNKKELEVGEHIIGAILGPGGRGIVELQKYTGANIQISKKGVYVPGTRNRIVSITGSPNSVSRANYLIQQRITQEETKRARQGQSNGGSR